MSATGPRGQCSSSPGRVRRRGPGEAVAEICRRVDGLPLAIELAAARCALLSPAEIAECLEAVLSAPGAGDRDGPARRRTLRPTIATNETRAHRRMLVVRSLSESKKWPLLQATRPADAA